MGKILSPRMRSALPLISALCVGAFAGAYWAMSLDDEQRRRVKKNLFELGEMPFRLFI